MDPPLRDTLPSRRWHVSITSPDTVRCRVTEFYTRDFAVKLNSVWTPDSGSLCRGFVEACSEQLQGNDDSHG
jgi:hypothetical protein